MRNAIEHAIVLVRTGILLPEHLPPPEPLLQNESCAASHPGDPDLTAASRRRAQELFDDPSVNGEVYARFLQEAEIPLLLDALKRFNFACAPAARALGMHRTTLKRKLDRYGIHYADRDDE